ncbi:MAG: hypothetical protein HQ552_05780 [Desulfobacteraceae bacterium]|nr:hypothetical protein [Desulfobacteraceae bacterium]
MQRLINFLKTTAQGGLFVLLPLLLLFLLLAEVMELLVGIATPIANLLHPGAFDEAKFPVILALLLLFGTSFVIGLWLRSKTAKRFGYWIEGKTVGRLPGYRFLKSLVTGLLGAEDAAGFKPAMLVSAEGQREFAYVVEDHGNGRLTVLVPWAPTAFAGSVKIVAKDQIELLDAGLSDVSLVLNHLGLGARDLLGKHTVGTLSSASSSEDVSGKGESP